MDQSCKKKRMDGERWTDATMGFYAELRREMPSIGWLKRYALLV